MNIKEIAYEYVNDRFPLASIKEKEKIVADWVNKITASQALVADFTSRIGNPAGKKVLDAGSGPGGVSIAFAQAGAHVSGIDIEKDLYTISQQYATYHGVSIDFRLYDGTKMPYEDNYFDYVVSVSVIEHVTGPELYLSEIYRVLKPEGVVYLGFPNKWWPLETHTQVWFLTYIPAWGRDFVVRFLNRNPLKANNLHFYSYFDLANMLTRIGKHSYLQIIQEEGKSTHPVKRLVRILLKLIHIPYKAFLPHILVLLQKR